MRVRAEKFRAYNHEWLAAVEVRDATVRELPRTRASLRVRLHASMGAAARPVRRARSDVWAVSCWHHAPQADDMNGEGAGMQYAKALDGNGVLLDEHEDLMDDGEWDEGGIGAVGGAPRLLALARVLACRSESPDTAARANAPSHRPRRRRGRRARRCLRRRLRAVRRVRRRRLRGTLRTKAPPSPLSSPVQNLRLRVAGACTLYTYVPPYKNKNKPSFFHRICCNRWFGFHGA